MDDEMKELWVDVDEAPEEDNIDDDFLTSLNQGEVALKVAEKKEPLEWLTREDGPPIIMPPGLGPEMQEMMLRARAALAERRANDIDQKVGLAMEEYDDEEIGDVKDEQEDWIDQDDFDAMMSEFIQDHKGDPNTLYQKYGNPISEAE
jgi:hypothetical protein